MSTIEPKTPASNSTRISCSGRGRRHATDPVMTLAARRAALCEALQPLVDAGSVMMPGDPREDENCAAQCVFFDKIAIVEDKMMETVATSAAGVSAQIEILRDFVAISKYEALIDIAQLGLAGLPDFAAKGGAA